MFLETRYVLLEGIEGITPIKSQLMYNEYHNIYIYGMK